MAKRRRKRQQPSEPHGLEHMQSSRAGHDGHKPVFMPVRDITGANGKREQILGLQNVNVNRIEYLFAKGHIDQRQHDAAAKLERDWELAQIQPRASSVIVGNGGGGSAPELPADTKVAAMKRHGAAMAATGFFWPIIRMVVEDHKSVEMAGSLLGLTRDRAAERLWCALHVLADHYRLPGQAEERVRERMARTTA